MKTGKVLPQSFNLKTALLKDNSFASSSLTFWDMVTFLLPLSLQSAESPFVELLHNYLCTTSATYFPMPPAQRLCSLIFSTPNTYHSAWHHHRIEM